jgi:phage/plasmid-associated DNA primase
MNVTKANHHARALLGDREVTVNDHTKYRRMGHAALTDLVAGDRLKVQVRGCKAGDPATMELLAKRVVAHPASSE